MRLKFKSCAGGGEWYGTGITPSSYGWVYVDIPANIATTISNAYASDQYLAGKVTGIGYGWQQYIVECSGKIKFTVRGAAGGTTGTGTIDAVTGACLGNVNRPGRGAKLVGEFRVKRGDILYMLVGMRGWCNNGADWGSGGGGASVLLIDDPTGPYTLTPVNRKVRVICVAGGGGGCYDSSFGSATYYGTDADYNNGINTNGGIANSTGGGAGLTGNGAAGLGGKIAYNLLSGTPSTSGINTIRSGGWGGGGVPYDGGGSGAGYSGGNSRGNSAGGSGGTSYMNPECTEISRGYATVEEDADRNCTNPWYAYGFIELETGRDLNKYILACDSEGPKWFDGYERFDGSINPDATSGWLPIPGVSTLADLDEEHYLTYGTTIINNTVGLSGPTKFLVRSPHENEKITVSGYANKVVVKQLTDVSLTDFSDVKSSSLTANLTNVDVRFAISKNSGRTWQTYNNGNWEDINIANRNVFASNGYQLSKLTTIPVSAWNAYKARTIRFALIISQNADDNSTLVDNVKFVADLVGAWKHYTEADATYSFTADNEISVTFKTAGNYKVNYVDKSDN